MRMRKKRAFDFTTGPILKNLVLFAIPLIISFTLQNLYNMVDMIVVGRMIGEEAIAAVGTTSGIFMLVTMFISGATVGMSVVVSQYLGAGDMKMVNRSIYTSLYLIMGFTAVTSVLGAVFTRQLLILIRTPENVLADAVVYLRIIFIGEAATAVYNMASQLMRSLGDSLTPMIMLIIASVLNVTLNILFVGPLHMGVAGVAYGTLLASAFAAVSCLVIAWRVLPVLRPTREGVRFSPDLAKTVIRIAIPSSLQSSMMSIGNICIQTGINTFGATYMAAFNAASKVDSFISFPPGGLTNGLQVFVGQNMGAKQLDRIRESVRKTFFVQLCYHTVTGFILLLFGKTFIRIFVSDGASAMINIGYTYLIFAAVGGLGNAVRALMLSALIGAGDSEAAFRASIVQLAVQVFCAFVLSRYLGYVGVFLGTPLGWAASGIYGLIRYHSGKWEEKGVV